MRPEVAASWVRSQLSGADPDRYLVPFELEKADQRGKLVRIAVLVLGRLSEQLGGLETSLSLTDAQGRILSRWVREPAARPASMKHHQQTTASRPSGRTITGGTVCLSKRSSQHACRCAT